METSLCERFWTQESILWFIAGLVIGLILSVLLNLKWAYMVRKWLGVHRKYSVHYLDCNTHDILDEDELEKQGERSYLRFVLIYDPITSSIIFNFTDYKDKPTLQHVHLPTTRFEFDFYGNEAGVEDNIYYYRMNKLRPFIRHIFWNPTNNDFKFGEITLSSPLEGTKKVFPDLPYPPRS